MNQSGIRKFLLLGLVVVTGLLLFRLIKGSPPPEGVVLLENDFALDDLRHTSFQIAEKSVAVRISAVGSLQTDSVLAAYPWILRRGDRALVWALRPDEVDQRDGTIVTVEKEFELEPGVFDVFFTSFGDADLPGIGPSSVLDRISAMLNKDFQKWRMQPGKWRLEIAPARNADEAYVAAVETDDYASRQSALTTVWETGPMPGNRSSEFLFETEGPLDLRLYAIGEYVDGFRDGGWIEDISSGSQIWEMSESNTQPAGGAVKNRVCDQVISLPQGRYRAVYKTNDKHDFKNWTSNPPFDPYGWGLKLDVVNESDLQAISAFDPWESLPRVASLTGIGDDKLVSHSFVVEQPLRVLVHALGEGFLKQGEMYDYAWIIDRKTERRVWEMRVKKTQHAGGSYKNRRAEAVLDLKPGRTYTVYYKTDGSHSFPDFNVDPPKHPQRWGVTVFSLDESFVPVDAGPQLNEPKAGPGADTGALASVDLSGLGDKQTVSKSFTLPESSRVRIFAVGELTRDGRYDYGWIAEEGSEKPVWEMTRSNTARAGGTSKNRKFDGTILLPAGSFTVHFKTDDSHSFPDFKYGGPPDNPAAWGITLEIIEERDEQEPG